MKKYALIVAGGIGTRMNSKVPKQFLDLCGKPILIRTLNIFYSTIPDINIILVLPADQHESWKKLCIKHGFLTDHKIVNGGRTRFDSVYNGLQEITEPALVAIHDGVRPLVDQRVIIKSFKVAETYGNAIPAIPIAESVRTINGDDNKHIDRESLRIIQTPQTFQVSIIQKAYKQQHNPKFTDDASVVEALGEPLNLIEGNIENIKITTEKDVIIAEALFMAENPKSQIL